MQIVRPSSRCASTVLLACLTLAAGACKKGEPPHDEARPTELPKLVDEPAAAVDKRPVEGAALEPLKPEERERFEALADQLPSPCGKAHSLRTSRNTDSSCGRARFGVDFVIALLADGASDDEIKQLYMARYPRERAVKAIKKDPSAPHSGPDDAPVVLVEYFDYGCPACGTFAPVLEEVQAAFPRDVAIHYKMFPIAQAHADSPGAAQAALAAHRQGKFKEMHKLLFADQHAHGKDKLDAYARQIGLDLAKYKADFAAAAPLIDADKAEGNQVGVQGTPTIFLNGVLWEGPPSAKYMKMWIDEELALNR